MVYFEFRNSRLAKKQTELALNYRANRDGNYLRHYYGNLIEMSNKKCEEICRMDIPQEDKNIAWDIRNEEIRQIRAEFDKKWSKTG